MSDLREAILEFLVAGFFSKLLSSLENYNLQHGMLSLVYSFRIDEGLRGGLV
jgi:hypothetical protein